MKETILLVFVVALANASQLFAEEVLVCFPDRSVMVSANKVVEQKLTAEESKKNAIILTKIRGKLLWKSRGNKEVKYVKSGVFMVFAESNGAGYVKVGNGVAMEHVHIGMVTYTYFGKVNLIKPSSLD